MGVDNGIMSLVLESAALYHAASSNAVLAWYALIGGIE